MCAHFLRHKLTETSLYRKAFINNFYFKVVFVLEKIIKKHFLIFILIWKNKYLYC